MKRAKHLFTYHIVNIKPDNAYLCLFLFLTFTYHIVNIKHTGKKFKDYDDRLFTYHIVNIKQATIRAFKELEINLHTT